MVAIPPAKRERNCASARGYDMKLAAIMDHGAKRGRMGQ
jgi:hypothetical protein